MATALRAIEPTVEEAVGALVDQTVANPVAVFTDENRFSDFYERLKEETDRHVPDLSTASGRKAIASLAFRVTKAKTTLDKAGLGLTEDWRAQIALVNTARKKMTTELDQLADEVRRPLTEWEETEKAREAACRTVVTTLKEAAIVTLDDTAATVMERGREVKATVIDPDQYGALFDEASGAKRHAWEQLKIAYERLTREEADRAELARLQAAEQERLVREAEERAQREAAEAAEREAREAEERRQREAEEARQRHEAEAERVAEAERQAAARAAQEERDRLQREHDAAMQEERTRTAEAERLAQAERDRMVEIERQREARENAEREEAERVAAKQRADEANKALQRRLKTEAKDAIMSCGVSEDAAQKIVLAIRAREIPHIVWAAQSSEQEA